MMVFAKVVENQSFTKAAEELNLGKARVSQIVTKLENDLNTRLLHRTTRSLSLTQSGAHYFEKCCAVRDIAQQANDMIQEDEHNLSGLIRISTPSMALIDLLSEFLTQYPAIKLDIVESDSYTNLIESRCDIALRASSMLEDSSLYAIKLGHFTDMICTSPEYLDKHLATGQPLECAEDLLKMDWISHHIVHGDKQLTLTATDHRVVKLAHTPKVSVRTSASVKGFLLHHHGFAIVPSFMVYKELESGKLVRLLPEVHDLKVPIYAVYQDKALMPARVRALIEFLKQRSDFFN